MNRDYYIECMVKYKGRLERKQKELAGLKGEIKLSFQKQEPFFVIEGLTKKCKKLQLEINDVKQDILWAEGHLSR